MDFTDADLLEVVASALSSHGIPARKLTQHIGEAVRREMGGSRVYIRQPGKQPRNESIHADHDNGTPVDELCNKYGLSKSQVYEIIGTRSFRSISVEPD